MVWSILNLFLVIQLIFYYLIILQLLRNTIQMQLGEFRTLSNLRWKHIVYSSFFRQYTKCKDAENYIARKIDYNEKLLT